MAYLNADGLWIKVDGEEGITQKGGHYAEVGSTPGLAELVIDFGDVTASPAIPGASTRGALGIQIPGGVRITEVELITETAVTSGGSATLDVGLIRYDRSTELDYDGLVAALALASFNAAGETVVLRVGSTSAGALIGTTLANPGIMTVNYATASLTAGKVKIRVKWYKPTTIG